MLSGAWIGGVLLFDDDCALTLARMAEHQTYYHWVALEGWQAPIC